jgi:hypothetical protein
MRPRLALFLVLCSLSALAPLAACGSAEKVSNPLPTTDDIDASKSKRDSSTSFPEDDAGTPLPEASTGPGRVYSHTKDTLYLYEPTAGTLKEIGKFTFDPADTQADIIDIAVDRTGNMFGTTFNDFFSIDTTTAKCTWIAIAQTAVDYPNALSFVPAGTADPGKEALVGYATSIGDSVAVTYVQIDTTTGAMTTKGNMNASASGPQYRSSGDVVSIIQDGNRTYATVKLQGSDAGAGTDLLAEVDPTDGHVKRIVGDTKQNDIFGFGYWAGKGYGFSYGGKILEIDMAKGSSTVLQTLTDDGGAPLPWYGAGVTTQAPSN